MPAPNQLPARLGGAVHYPRAGTAIPNLVKNIVINIVKNIVINIVKNIVFLEAEALTRNPGFLEDGDLKILGKRDGDN